MSFIYTTKWFSHRKSPKKKHQARNLLLSTPIKLFNSEEPK